MAATTVERMRQILGSSSNLQERFIVLALMELLGDTAVDAILDSLIPKSPDTQVVLFGRKIGDYSGISRDDLKATFKKEDGSFLNDADVDEIFTALGAVTGTSGPMGTPSAPRSAKQAAALAEKNKAEDAKKLAASKEDTGKKETAKQTVKKDDK